METYLFFDDQRLFVREGLTRRYGVPELLSDSLFRDAGTRPANAFVSAVRDGADTRLFYQAHDDRGLVFLAATSKDGVRFEPWAIARENGIGNPEYPNQLLPRMDGELARVMVDPSAPEGQRFKALVCLYRHDELDLEDRLYESGDGRRWSLARDVLWHRAGTEPGVGAFFNPIDQKSVILARPFWGVRRVCYIETSDFRTFSEPRLALQCDALDRPLDEPYGMPAFYYKGLCVGLLWLFHVPAGESWKYSGGTVDCQLTYSCNGEHWMRSLREPFISTEEAPFTGMVYPSAALVADNGDILLYASGTSGEHGDFTREDARIGVYRLREDGFIRLSAGKAGGRLMTRQMLLRGPFSVNLTAARATCAIRDEESRPIAGFDHADCRVFSGDDTHWQPVFSEAVGALFGRVVTIEVRLYEGDLYAIEGDFAPLMNTEAMRYKKFGVLPKIKGF